MIINWLHEIQNFLSL